MKTFNLKPWPTPVPVYYPEEDITEDQLNTFPAFKTWLSALEHNLQLQHKDEKHPFHKKPYELKAINILAVTFFGKNPRENPSPRGFIYFKATILNEDGGDLPGIVFLRGDSVAMLMILKPRDEPDERWVIMTEQPRIPAGSLSFWEIPAGMLDRMGTFVGAAAKEIEEETGLVVKEDELKDLTKLALGSGSRTEKLSEAMYPSPGGCDESIHIYLWEKVVDRQELLSMKDKLTGLRRQGEMITLKLIRYEDIWKAGVRDAKSLAAWTLYEALQREAGGKL
jgi:ADP-sugar diphosphatase